MSFYNKYLSNFKCENVNVKFKGYTGENIVPKCKINVNVRYNKLIMPITFYLIEAGSTCLVGRDFMKKFNMLFTDGNINSVTEESIVLRQRRKV